MASISARSWPLTFPITAVLHSSRAGTRRRSPALSHRAGSRGLGPLEHDLAALGRVHGLEALLEIVGREAVRDHRPDVEPGADEGAHPVPGLEHLPPVDASDR